MVNTHLQDIFIFDRSRIRKNRERSLKKFGKHDFLFRWSATELSDRLLDINRTFDTALQIGGRGILERHPKIRSKMVMDITDFPTEETSLPYIQASEELLPFKENSLDLIISNLSLHTVNDLPGALIQIRRALKSDGLFIGCLFGGETLHELRSVLTQTELEIRGGVSPRVFPFADKPQMGDLLQRAGFTLPVVDSEIITVTYENIFNLMHELRGMGEGNAIAVRDNSFLGKDYFMKAAGNYAQNFSEDGRIIASFEIIFLLGWAAHDSQQKPLRPGSAKNKLADALGGIEFKTGDETAP